MIIGIFLKKFEKDLKQTEAELDDALNQLAQSQNREKYLDQDLTEATENMERIRMELGEAQKEMEKWRNECSEKRAEIDELLAIVAELNEAREEKGKTDKMGGGTKKRDDNRKEKQKRNGDGDASSSAASSPGGQQASLLDTIELVKREDRMDLVYLKVFQYFFAFEV